MYIVSADAKDLYLYNYSHGGSEYSAKYSSGPKEGKFNLNRFSNALDYSLDTIKLKEVFSKVYPDKKLVFKASKKRYCQYVINVTFKYSVKEYNRFGNDVFCKFGWLPSDIELEDSACVQDGQLVAIKLNNPVEKPLEQDVLGRSFEYAGGEYKLRKEPRTLVGVADLRRILYQQGFVCDGIKFRRFKRSSGSGRVGKCLFIDEKLYPAMHEWELCGLDIKEGQEIDLAGTEAYIALTLSSIIDTMKLKPENFLIIDDFDSVFRDKVIAVRADDDGWMTSAPEEVEISNCIWDGQSLIDKGAMGKYDQFGMILLRNRLFKSACFNCNIQQFFADNGITGVDQLNGITSAKSVANIKIITTPNSIKYAKYGSIQDWLKTLEGGGGTFGIVKHEKPTHFFDGRMVQVHYQLLNSLQMTQQEVDELVKPSLDYLRMINNDPAAMRFHIKWTDDTPRGLPMCSSSDVVYRLLGVNDKFADTKVYYKFKENLTRALKKDMRCGHILVHGNYSTLCGNPIEMLKASIGVFDGQTTSIAVGTVHSINFEDGQEIVGTRSPHITAGDVLLARNVISPEVNRYMNLSNEIVCVNSMNENLLMRLAGSDFDADALLLSDNNVLVKAAKRNYEHFLVPTSFIGSTKRKRYYTPEHQADLDTRSASNLIGVIVNLSQELNTKMWHVLNNGGTLEDVEELYCDISKLSILSGCAIDSSKREFPIDIDAEIKKMRGKYTEKDGDGKSIKPNFFGHVARIKGYYDGERKNYAFHDTTMDYLQHSINSFRLDRRSWKQLPLSTVLKPIEDDGDVNIKKVKMIIDYVRMTHAKLLKLWNSRDGKVEPESKTATAIEYKRECLDYVSKKVLNPSTAYAVLESIEQEDNSDVAQVLFTYLFSAPNKALIALIDQSQETVAILDEQFDGTGDIDIHGFKFIKKSIPTPEFNTNYEG